MKKIIFCFMVCALFCSDMYAQSVKALLFHSQLFDKNNNSISGSFKIVFKIYESEKNLSVPIWSEEHNNVKVVDGFLNVKFGNIKPVDWNFEKEYILGISIENDEEMNPKLKFKILQNTNFDNNSGDIILLENAAGGANILLTNSQYQLNISENSIMVSSNSNNEIENISAAKDELVTARDLPLKPAREEERFQPKKNSIDTNFEKLNISGEEQDSYKINELIKMVSKLNDLIKIQQIKINNMDADIKIIKERLASSAKSPQEKVKKIKKSKKNIKKGNNTVR